MGIVVRFHVPSLRDRDSKVISEQPRSEAKRTNSDQRRGGIPRLRHVETVESETPSAEETALVPPSASIVESAVSTMAPNIVCTSQTCQALTTCQPTKSADCGSIPSMKEGSSKEIGRRLRRTRLALGYQKQTDFCAEIGLAKSLYNPFETGARRLTLACACAIRTRFGVSLDWLYCADPTALPADLSRKLLREAA